MPKNVADIMFLTTSVLSKHVADGATSPLPNFADMNALAAKLQIAQTSEAQRLALFAQAKHHTEARDVALGKYSSATPAAQGTVLFEVRHALAVLKGAYPISPTSWALWGFDVVTSSRTVWKNAAGNIVPSGTAGATAHSTKHVAKVVLPKKDLTLIALAKAIIAKHIADGANSPLTNFVDTATLQAKLQIAESENILSLQLHRDAETARSLRDVAIWGDADAQTTKVAGSIMHELTNAAQGLAVIYKTNLHLLGAWGFTVNAATSPTTPATPPTPTPPSGGGGNNPNNPN